MDDECLNSGRESVELSSQTYAFVAGRANDGRSHVVTVFVLSAIVTVDECLKDFDDCVCHDEVCC